MTLKLLKASLLICLLVPAISVSEAKVGVILPLTGPLAEYGVAMKNGIDLAKRTNTEVFKRVEFLYEDSRYDPKTTITSFRKFISDPDVKFVINFGCPPSQAIVPLVEQREIPTAMFCSAMLMTKGKKFSFGMTAPANEWAEVLWSYLSSQNFNKICLLLTENDYLISEFNALRQQSGVDIDVIDRFTPQETDFRSSILKLKSKSCDALGVYLLPGQVRTFFTQSNQYDFSHQVFGTDIFESKEEILAAKKGMEGAVFANLAVPEPFKVAYEGQFGNANQVTMACIMHDLVLRIVPLVTVARSPSDLMQKISALKKETFRCGPSEFVSSENGEQFVRFPVVLKTVLEDDITTTVTAQKHPYPTRSTGSHQNK